MRAILRKSLPLAAVAALASGCGGSMTLEAPSIPTPLVEKIDARVGLRMSPEMYMFSHEESVLGRDKWSVDMGDSNAQLFRQLFTHMFTSVSVLTETDDPQAQAIDALVETSIDDFEFSTPEQTGTEAFAVWIRYRLKVYNRDGDMVANWPVSAYGKSESTVLGASRALEQAAVLAMRDAAALMIMKLDRETGIGALANTATPPAGEEPPVETENESPVNASNISSFSAAGAQQDAI